MPEISIVIPVYNSHECVEELSRQIADSMNTNGITYEQIMVNDCSRDSSWEEILRVCLNNKNIIGINLRKNGGQDTAILAGLNYASGNYIVIMDDDLQHSPYDIPKLYDEVKKGYDVCFANFGHKEQKFWKNAGSWFNDKVSEIALQKPKGIYLSPFKIIHKSVIDEIVKMNNLYPYIGGLIFQVTKNVTQISIPHHKREAGKSNYTFIKSIKYFLRMLFCFSTTPLYITFYIGVISAILGFGLGIYYAVQKFMGLIPIQGWTTITILILIIGGCILLSLGIIGKYLGQIYLTVNKTPKFIIKDIKNKN